MIRKLKIPRAQHYQCKAVRLDKTVSQGVLLIIEEEGRLHNGPVGPLPERIYNSNYGNGDAGNVYLLVLSSWKVNIAENPIAVIRALKPFGA